MDTDRLRIVASDDLAAAALPPCEVVSPAAELLARRAMADVENNRPRRERKDEAIMAAFARNFRMTGKHNQLFRLDTIADVLVDEVQAAGWRDTTHRDVHEILHRVARDPIFPVSLKTPDIPHLGPRTFMHGVVAQGAAT
jgi:hypothetical protein